MNIISLIKGTLKYHFFVLGTICMGVLLPLHQPHVAYGMESAAKAYSPLPAAFAHFEEDKGHIHGYLKQVKEAELHFFWTTGRTLSDNPAYNPDTKVNIGGAEYGQKFFPYVDKLLENSPDNLKVKFVCDTMTIKSNAHQLTMLQDKYGDRFKILPIETVQENLLKTFSSDADIKKINLVFKNATQGSPVLASDIYRVIGMVYSQDHPSDVTQTQYTYCDIDAFCYGMESLSHIELIKALFDPITKTPFYFGRSEINNDLIKLRITNLQDYDRFCKIMLNRIERRPVLDHYSNIHDTIKLCEQTPQNCSHLISQIPPPLENLVLQVTQTTGPKFLDDFGFGINKTLSYPRMTIGEWGAPEEILDHTVPGNAFAHPPSVLSWGSGNTSPEEKKAENAFIEDCDDYRKILSAAFYAKRFGEHHPFNVTIKKYLLDRFPFQAISFKNLLKINFDFHKKDINEKYEINTVEKLPKNSELHKNILYVKKEGNQLKYKAIKPNENITNGTIEITTDQRLIKDSFNKKKSIILQKAIKMGIVKKDAGVVLLESMLENDDLSMNILYVAADGDQLKYTIITPKNVLNGTLPINLNPTSPYAYKDQILKEASQKGLTLEPKKGLSYEEWKQEAFNRITTLQGHENYYLRLIRLLKELGIEIPFTKKSLDFQAS